MKRLNIEQNLKNRYLIENEQLENNNNKLNFVKVSLQTEVRSLNESIKVKDEKLLNQQNINYDLKRRNLALDLIRADLENKNNTMLKHIDCLNAKYLNVDEAEKLSVQILNSNSEIVSLENVREKLSLELSKCNLKIKMIEKDMEICLKENLDLKNRLDDFGLTEKKLIEKLEKSQTKREIARKELIKISKLNNQDLQNVKDKTKFKLDHDFQNLDITKLSEFTNMDNKEIEVINYFKQEVEQLYKTLMCLMIQSSTSEAKNLQILNIPTINFSTFERRLNNLVMQFHEMADSSEPITKKSSILSSISFNSKVNIFSCISSQNEPYTINSLTKRRRCNTYVCLANRPIKTYEQAHISGP